MPFSSTENRFPVWIEILNSTALLIRSHFLHFYAISIIFLFPIFFTLVVYPSFHLALFHRNYSFTILTQLSLSYFEIIALTICTLFLALFFLCAVATITYSAVQAFHDRPISIISSIKSIRSSFFPLLSVFISITVIFAFILVVLLQLLKILGLTVLKYDSNHFLISPILVIVPVLLWLQVNWSLAYAIAAVESKCGFEALRRSAYLMKGMRWVAFWANLFYGLAIGAIVVGTNVVFVLLGAAGKGNYWRSSSGTSRIVECTVLGTLGMNQFLVLNVVLYMYCKDLKGEILPIKSVSLPLDDEKKNHNVV